jgi:hypothetical protein
MAEFINGGFNPSDEGVGLRLEPRPRPTLATNVDGMDAFGKIVPDHRKSAALKHMRQMAPSISTEAATQVIDRMAEQIARDEPYKVLAIAKEALDLTGAYRLMAVLCTAEGWGS